MATDIAIASLPTLAAASIQGDDILPIVDVHDLTDPGGTTKAGTVDGLGYYAIPKSGRTVATLPSYLSNNAVFNVLDYGADPTGVADSTAAIQAALTAAAGVHGAVYLPPGTYVTSATLTMAANTTMTGVAMQSTIQPSAALSTGCAVQVGSSCLLERLKFDGANTTGGSGIGVGATTGSTITGSPRVRDVWIQGFVGASTSAGLVVGNAVDASIRNVWSSYNNYGLMTVSGTGGCPTATMFEDCYFHENLTQGCWIQAGTGMTFLSCIFESSYNEGLYIYNASTPATPVTARFVSCWFEGNWLSLAGNASRANQYSVWVNGVWGQFAPTGIQFVNCQLNETPGTAAPQAIRLTAAIDFLVEACEFQNVLCLLTEDYASGVFSHWRGAPLYTGNYLSNTSANPIVCDTPAAGTFTPVFADAETGGNVATGTMTGFWARIGKLVTVTVTASGIGTSGMTGGNRLSLQNLPFPAITTTIAPVYAYGIAFAKSPPVLQVVAGKVYTLFWENATGTTGAYLTVAELTSGTADLQFTVAYETA